MLKTFAGHVIEGIIMVPIATMVIVGVAAMIGEDTEWYWDVLIALLVFVMVDYKCYIERNRR